MGGGAGVFELPGWVIDGNYTGFLYGRRMEEADRIIFLDLPRWVCFYQAWRRCRANRGRVRESMAPAVRKNLTQSLSSGCCGTAGPEKMGGVPPSSRALSPQDDRVQGQKRDRGAAL